MSAERLPIGLSLVMPTRLAAVRRAKLAGLSCVEVVEDVRGALSSMAITPTAAGQAEAGWLAAVATVYGRSPLQFALLHLEDQANG